MQDNNGLDGNNESRADHGEVDCSDSANTTPETCDECGEKLTEEHCYKCSQCKTHNMCADCFDDNGAHIDHASQVSVYYRPGSTKDLSCKCCGETYDTKEDCVICCKYCRTYYMCNKCMHEGMHTIHSGHFEKMTLLDYKSIIK